MEISRRRLLSFLSLSAAGAVVPHTWAEPVPIAEEHFAPIGGIEQWVAIRGRDRSRTPILFLHGGPCEAESPFLSVFAPWEERYVVAQWDQRGTGRTLHCMCVSVESMCNHALGLLRTQRDAEALANGIDDIGHV